MKSLHKIFQINADNFEIIGKFKSAKEASTCTGIRRYAIINALMYDSTHKLNNEYWVHGTNLLNFINEKLKQRSAMPLIVVKHLQTLQITYGKQKNNT